MALVTWVRTGHAAGLVALLGRGELLPPAVLLAGEALAVNYGVPTPLRTAWWRFEVILGWSLVVGSSALFPVPYSGTTGYEARLASTSVAVFTAGVACRLRAARRESRGGP